jgi:hypothetical protein
MRELLPLIEMSDAAERAFQRYFDSRGAEFKREQNAYHNEIGTKLGQITYALQAVHASLVAHEGDRLNHKLMERVAFYTEAFYLFAFRAKTAIARVPGLSDIKCDGVRNVRNHLIEHPEGGSSGIIFGGFTITSWTGPVVKGIRYAEQSDRWRDHGLYANAKEYFDNLLSMMARATEAVQHQSPP